MAESVITVPEGEENQLKLSKRFLQALLMSHFYLACVVAGAPAWLLEREIKDIRIDGDFVIVFYEEEGE